MKILAIRGKNLASLEKEFEVDFMVEPLKSAGIFAITGRTGSGKSTLLDALCIALFDTSPRINSASENISVNDIGDRMINQHDCRTILRRGAADGYAETDFVSLGGERFRSRWSVRRAFFKADGAMKNSEISLLNLSTGKEEQGSKKELLKKITELIGLTFDQFIRSVLLAQGDFANFLKAKQAEKAELLEKLTGTTVFSQISIAIYEKAKEAETQWNILNERIKGIELLSDDHINELLSEKDEKRQVLSVLAKENELLTAQLKWMDEKDRLNNLVKEAESGYASRLKAIEDARERFEYIAQVDAAQTIRDTFGLLKNNQKQLAGHKNNLQSTLHEREENGKRLSEARLSLSENEKELKQLLEKQKEIAPQIIKARELDVQIRAAKVTKDDAQKEYDAAKTSFDKTTKSLAGFKQEYLQKEKILSALNLWFEDNKTYAALAPRTELLVTLAKDAEMAGKQMELNKKTLAVNLLRLDEKQIQLEKLKQEGERLSRLLPAEIAALRDRLTDGEPCPVCGSTVHPATKTEDRQRMKEQELKKAQENNAKQTEALITDIENGKNETARLSAQIESYTGQFNKAYSSLETNLACIPQWKELFEHATLVTFLNTRTEQWESKTVALTKTKEEIDKLATTITHEENKLKEGSENLTVKTERFVYFRKNEEQLLSDRATVLNGKPADAAEQYFVDGQNRITEKIKKATDAQNVIIAKHESLTGIISRIQTDIRQSEEKHEELHQQVDTWLKERKNFTYELLTELFEVDNTWIQFEKQALKMLAEAETTVKATLSERLKNLEYHHSSKIKPEQEAKEIIQGLLMEKKEAVELLTKRITEIETLLSSNSKSKEQIKGLEKELQEKSALTENWKKLNMLLGSANGNKFKETAQGYTLDILLMYANRHLQELAPRYVLQRAPEKLGLQVVDTDMLNEVRSIHSLSGGETFLTSLALALGLSSLSSNRMKVESLFIDEGFGSLDSDTLRIAMDALEQLRTQGRKIGVISHVAEMTERIAVRINVLKTSNNKSVIDI